MADSKSRGTVPPSDRPSSTAPLTGGARVGVVLLSLAAAACIGLGLLLTIVGVVLINEDRAYRRPVRPCPPVTTTGTSAAEGMWPNQLNDLCARALGPAPVDADGTTSSVSGTSSAASSSSSSSTSSSSSSSSSSSAKLADDLRELEIEFQDLGSPANEDDAFQRLLSSMRRLASLLSGHAVSPTPLEGQIALAASDLSAQFDALGADRCADDLANRR